MKILVAYAEKHLPLCVPKFLSASNVGVHHGYFEKYVAFRNGYRELESNQVLKSSTWLVRKSFFYQKLCHQFFRGGYIGEARTVAVSS